VDRAVHAAAAHELCVGRVDEGIRRLVDDVALKELNHFFHLRHEGTKCCVI
jgi:hypothetical protein